MAISGAQTSTAEPLDLVSRLHGQVAVDERRPQTRGRRFDTKHAEARELPRRLLGVRE